MFDIFYSGVKPNLFVHEQQATDLAHARELCKTRYFWWINYLTDYSGFDFLWEPVPWESHQTHVWPSQHQENGGTYLVPKEISTETNRNHRPLQRKGRVPVIGIDHGQEMTMPCDMITRFISDYLGTMRRVLSKVDSEYVWVVSSVCDYSHFDFTWHPSEWQHDMLHVFPSNEQKFGDTFFVHVPSFLQKSKNIALLEWFETLNFVDIPVPRRSIPVVLHSYDSQATAVKEYEFKEPVAMFTHGPVYDSFPTINLWREKTRTVTCLTSGAGIILVPRDAKNYLIDQVYDYPYIDKTQIVGDDPVSDVIFISNGEPMAQQNWQILKQLCPRAKHSQGVNGREAAYKAAAALSDTPWFFAVFAKTEVLPDFKSTATGQALYFPQ